MEGQGNWQVIKSDVNGPLDARSRGISLEPFHITNLLKQHEESEKMNANYPTSTDEPPLKYGNDNNN